MSPMVIQPRQILLGSRPMRVERTGIAQACCCSLLVRWRKRVGTGRMG